MDRLDVRELLKTHAAFDAAEDAALKRIHSVLKATDPRVDLGSRDSTVPGHFTTSSVVISSCSEDVLLVHHASFGLWIQPGGHVEASDATLMGAALRELLEETGLKASDVEALGLLDVAVHDVPAGIKGKPAHQHFDLRFAFRAHTRSVQASSDAKDARWFARETVLMPGVVDTDESVRAAIRRLSRLL